MVPDVTWGLKTFYRTLPPNDVCFDVILRHSRYSPSTAYHHLHLRALRDVGGHVCLPSCVPHGSTVLSKHRVGVEPQFCLVFGARGRACARAGRGTTLEIYNAPVPNKCVLRTFLRPGSPFWQGNGHHLQHSHAPTPVMSASQKQATSDTLHLQANAKFAPDHVVYDTCYTSTGQILCLSFAFMCSSRALCMSRASYVQATHGAAADCTQCTACTMLVNNCTSAHAPRPHGKVTPCCRCIVLSQLFRALG